MERWIRITAVGLIGIWFAGAGNLAGAAETKKGEAQMGKDRGAPAVSADSSSQKLSHEEMQQTQAVMEQMMVPVMGQMMSVMMESMAKTLAQKQVAENLATFSRNYYLALINRGFSEDEAMRIVTAAGIPTTGGGKQ